MADVVKISQVTKQFSVFGVLPTVVSSGAIWTEIETGFHIELEAPVRINVLPD